MQYGNEAPGTVRFCQILLAFLQGLVTNKSLIKVGPEVTQKLCYEDVLRFKESNHFHHCGNVRRVVFVFVAGFR